METRSVVFLSERWIDQDTVTPLGIRCANGRQLLFPSIPPFMELTNLSQLSLSTTVENTILQYTDDTEHGHAIGNSYCKR